MAPSGASHTRSIMEQSMKPQASRVARDLAVEQSLDAAIELDEVIKGIRDESPAFGRLVMNLIGSPTREVSVIKKDLFSDSRLASLYYRAAAASSGKAAASAEDMDWVLDLLLSAGAARLSTIPQDNLSIVREFCINLNKELIGEAFARTPEPPMARTTQQKFALSNAY